jgi:hypothetical protein
MVRHVWWRREQNRRVRIEAWVRSNDLRISGGGHGIKKDQREAHLLSAFAIVIRAVNGSAMSSKSDLRFIGAGFEEIGSSPAKHIETI